MNNLARSADAHADQLEASMVNTDSGSSLKDDENQIEPEDDFDETLSTDETLIKDFNEIFDQEQSDQ